MNENLSENFTRNTAKGMTIIQRTSNDWST